MPLSIGSRLPDLKGIIYDEPRGMRDHDHRQLFDLDQVIADGGVRLAGQCEVWLDREVAAGRGDDVSIILYTPGTTGRSKGMMLTHTRCIAAARWIRAFDQLNGRVEVLACLPMAWVGDHYMI